MKVDRINQRAQGEQYKAAARDAVQEAMKDHEYPSVDAVISAYVHLVGVSLARLSLDDQKTYFEDACAMIYQTMIQASPDLSGSVIKLSTTPINSVRH